LAIRCLPLARTFALAAHPDRRGSGVNKKEYLIMMNLVEKFTPEAVEATSDDEGAVTIEYVLVAAAVALGIGAVFATGLWTKLNTKLSGLLD
jgi:Flp pilus assembly pilin Flp